MVDQSRRGFLRGTTLAGAAALALIEAAAQTPPPPALDVLTELAAQAQDAGHGHELFTTTGCSLCHGTVGQGTPVGGPAWRPAPRQWRPSLQSCGIL